MGNHVQGNDKFINSKNEKHLWDIVAVMVKAF